MQVMAKVAGERNLPPHNVHAASAAEAYSYEAIVPQEGDGAEHLGTGYLLRAVAQPGNLQQMQAQTSYAKRADGFVDHMLRQWAQGAGSGAEGGAAEARRRQRCHWLALYSTLRKVARVRAGTVIALDALVGGDGGTQLQRHA